MFYWEKRLLEEIAEKLHISLQFEPFLVFKDEDSKCVIALYRFVVKGYCPFFNRQTKLCSIHDQKPLACKMYPLLVEMPTARLLLSAGCEWVRRHQAIVTILEKKPDLIAVVFPREFEAAKIVLTEFRAIDDIVKEKNLVRVSDLGGCREVYDFDEYIARFG